jgi:hypothetical protein
MTKAISQLSEITPALWERTPYKLSVNILFIYSYENVQFCSYAVRPNISFLTLPPLLLNTRVLHDVLTKSRQFLIGSRQKSRDENPITARQGSV